MFGYATNETENYMPLALDIAHNLLIELAALRRENKEIKYLRPDAKSQVTLEYMMIINLYALMRLLFLHSMMILIKKLKC